MRYITTSRPKPINENKGRKDDLMLKRERRKNGRVCWLRLADANKRVCRLWLVGARVPILSLTTLFSPYFFIFYFAGKLVNVPLEQLPLLFKAVLHSCKSSLSTYRSNTSPCVTKGSAPANWKARLSSPNDAHGTEAAVTEVLPRNVSPKEKKKERKIERKKWWMWLAAILYVIIFIPSLYLLPDRAECILMYTAHTRCCSYAKCTNSAAESLLARPTAECVPLLGLEDFTQSTSGHSERQIYNVYTT